MSSVYRPPSVDHVHAGYTDDAPSPNQGWLAVDPSDGLPPPFPSPTSARDASDNVAHEGHHMSPHDTSTPGNPRSRQRSATVRRHSSLPASGPDSPTRRRISTMDSNQSTLDEVAVVDPESSSDETIVPADTDGIAQQTHLPTSPTESTLTSFSSLTGRTHAASGSSGSGSTITQASWPRRRGSDKSRAQDKSYYYHYSKGRQRSRSPKAQPLSSVLNYLEPDSPGVTPEAIQRSVEQSSYWRMPDASSFQSPSTRSTSSTASSSFQSDVFSEMTGDHETDRSSSPDQSAYGDLPSMPGKFEVQMATAQRQQDYRSYGTPEMPRGTANFPHLPPNALQPRLPAVHHGHPKHLPRAEKLPLTGYELIASKLCAADSDRSSIKPIYRRFEALNHRLLLHLQDELAELEEQLHRLDTADTQTRRMQNCILPASRRQDALTAGELQWHKTDVLGKIGYKLSQYSTTSSRPSRTPSTSLPPIPRTSTSTASTSPTTTPSSRSRPVSSSPPTTSSPSPARRPPASPASPALPATTSRPRSLARRGCPRRTWGAATRQSACAACWSPPSPDSSPPSRSPSRRPSCFPSSPSP
ncbi:hypothetical protein CGRA01v4_09841 [Colletotrichum graminicola]|nr:hypothetical protein CGRA01v4_09841 [Colletotrichum graminicola]